MRRLFFYVLFFAGFLPAVAQDCPEMSLEFSTQQQLNQFYLDYPDCECLDVNMEINVNGNFDFSPLNNIEKSSRPIIVNTNDFAVNGLLNNLKFATTIVVNSEGSELDLVNSFIELDTLSYDLRLESFYNNMSLLNINAFNNLRYVGGSLVIEYFILPDSINLFQNIKHSGSIIFRDLLGVNGSFILSGFGNLESTGYLNFRNLSADYIPVFESLVTIEGELEIEAAIQTDVYEGFNSLVEVGEGITFLDNRIKTLKGFDLVQDINNKIVITRNGLNELDVFNSILQANAGIVISEENLLIFKGFSSLRNLNKYLFLVDLKKIEIIEAFENLKTINEYVDIRGADSLRNLGFLSNLESVSRLAILDNYSLRNFVGLEKLNKLTGYLKVNNNRNMESFDGLNNIELIGSYCEILFNPSLGSLRGLESLKKIQGDFYLMGNWNLHSLDELSLLESVGTFRLQNNKYLTNISGLANLKRIDGIVPEFYFEENHSIKDLNGLENLNDDIRKIVISKNDSLEDVSAISGLFIEESDGYIQITHNPNLQTCRHANICRAIRNNDYYIKYNGQECYENYLSSNCGHIGLDEGQKDVNFSCIYNSNLGTLKLEINSDVKIESMKIINSLGQQVFSSSQNVKSYNLPQIGSGIYLIALTTNIGEISKRFYIVN